MYDVIVVGGGPSGAIAALECARRNMATLLLEQKKLPRFKPCGGGLTLKGIKLLKELGISIPINIIEGRFCGIKVFTPQKKCIEITNGEDLGILFSRNVFDSFLVKKAIKMGAEVKDGICVKNVQLSDRFVKVITNTSENYKSKYVIGADGVTSVVAHASGLFNKWNRCKIGLGLQTEVAVRNVEDYIDPNFIYTYYGFDRSISGWIFPKKNHLNIGLGGRLSDFNNPYQKFLSFVNKINFLKGLAVPEPNLHLIPFGGLRKKILKERILLTGDAAGFVDVRTGEGIYYAMLSGKLAAETINNDKIESYWNSCYNKIWKDLRASLIMTILSERMVGLSTFQLFDQSIRKHMIATIKGEESYSDYLPTFFYTILRDLPRYLYSIVVG